MKKTPLRRFFLLSFVKISKICLSAVLADFLVGRGRGVVGVGAVDLPAVEEGGVNGVLRAGERAPHAADAGLSKVRSAVFHMNIALRTDALALAAADAFLRRLEVLSDEGHRRVFDAADKGDLAAKRSTLHLKSLHKCDFFCIFGKAELHSQPHSRRHAVRVAEDDIVGQNVVEFPQDVVALLL